MITAMLKWTLNVALGLSPPLTSVIEQTPIDAQHSANQGMILGRITEEVTGAALAGAEVSLSCDCPMGSIQTETNRRGVYSFSALRAGIYLVRVSVAGIVVEKTIALPENAVIRSNLSIELSDAESLQFIAPPVNHTTHGCGHCTAGDGDSLGFWGLLLAFGLLCTSYCRRYLAQNSGGERTP